MPAQAERPDKRRGGVPIAPPRSARRARAAPRSPPCSSALRLGRLHHPVDEQAKPAFGRDAAGRGVRSGEQPELLEILHDVADRGGREVDARQPRDGPRPDGRAGAEIGSRPPSGILPGRARSSRRRGWRPSSGCSRAAAAAQPRFTGWIREPARSRRSCPPRRDGAQEPPPSGAFRRSAPPWPTCSRDRSGPLPPCPMRPGHRPCR